jgi:membrane dipeptidase
MRTDSPRTTSYESYDYLGERKRRAVPFEFPPEIDRVQSTRPSLTDEQERYAQELMDRHPVISLHDHPTRRPADPAEGLAYRNSGRDVTGYSGLAASPLDAVFDNMMNVNTMIVSKGGWTWNDVVHDLGMRQCDFAHSDLVTVLHTVQDIFEAKRTGKVGTRLQRKQPGRQRSRRAARRGADDIRPTGRAADEHRWHADRRRARQ